MRTRNGLTISPSRMMGESGKHTWVVAFRHYPWSITWSWALYWTKPGLVPWTRYLWTWARWSMNGHGSLHLPLGFLVSWQPSMRRTA